MIRASWHYLSMFDIEIAADTLPHGLAPDQLEQDLITIESTIGRLRARQLRLLRRVDLAQIAARDGSRSLHEWTAARLDITAKLAADLVTASRTIPDDLDNKLTVGEMSFDRAVATSHLVVAGASERLVDDSAGFDLAGVGRLAAQHRAMTPKDEVEVFDSRHTAIQLSLDQTSANVWATLTGVDSEIVTQALDQWADSLPKLPDGTRDSRAHRQADAFVAIFRNALGKDLESETTSGRGPHVLLTADLALLAQSGGTRGVAVVGGPRVGINALEEALCNGSVSLDVKLEDGRILGLGDDVDAIPPRVRRYVLARDGGCTADGCGSRHHLQVHHIVPRSQGGTHDPENLTTLCWYHHHVVIHGRATRSIPTAHRSVAASNPRESTHPDHSGLLRSPTPTTTTQPSVQPDPDRAWGVGAHCHRLNPTRQLDPGDRRFGSETTCRTRALAEVRRGPKHSTSSPSACTGYPSRTTTGF